MSTPLYLAGPMTGIPKFNYPAFAAAAKHLRELGYVIVSPAELDDPAVQAAANDSRTGTFTQSGTLAGQTWGDLLARDVKLITDTCKGIVFLQGWANSRGAKLEATVALLCEGHRFYAYDGDIVEIPAEWVKSTLLANL